MKTIVVSDAIWEKLMQQKLKLKAKSLSELIDNCLSKKESNTKKGSVN